MIRNPRLHSRSDAQGLMDASEVVPQEVNAWAATWFSIFFGRLPRAAPVSRIRTPADLGARGNSRVPLQPFPSGLWGI
jgi:hypothetical protein